MFKKIVKQVIWIVSFFGILSYFSRLTRLLKTPKITEAGVLFYDCRNSIADMYYSAWLLGLALFLLENIFPVGYFEFDSLEAVNIFYFSLCTVVQFVCFALLYSTFATIAYLLTRKNNTISMPRFCLNTFFYGIHAYQVVYVTWLLLSVFMVNNSFYYGSFVKESLTWYVIALMFIMIIAVSYKFFIVPLFKYLRELKNCRFPAIVSVAVMVAIILFLHIVTPNWFVERMTYERKLEQQYRNSTDFKKHEKANCSSWLLQYKDALKNI